jgi:hypothetical protein
MRIPGRDRTPRPGSRPLDLLRRGWWGRILRAIREQVRAPSHGQLVDDGYRALLEREPDADGRRHYVRGLYTGGVTREQVLRHLGGSPEAVKEALLRPGMQDHVAHFTSKAPEGVPPICFLHTMKCGGTALTHGLAELAEPWPRLIEVWADQLVCMPRPLLERTMLVTGHLPYPVVDVLPEHTVVLTVVREPVSRTLSHLAHVRTHGGRPDLTLEQFVRDDGWGWAWRNYQARQLASDAPVRDAWLGRVPAGSLQAIVDGPLTRTDQELGDRAQQRLASIQIVGVADDLDAVVRTVADLWGKPAFSLARENTSLAPVREAPADLLDEIRAGTEVDAALYEAAKQRS